MLAGERGHERAPDEPLSPGQRLSPASLADEACDVPAPDGSGKPRLNLSVEEPGPAGPAGQDAETREEAADGSADAPRTRPFLGKHEHAPFSSRKQAPEDRVRAGDLRGAHLELGRAEAEEKGSLPEQPELDASVRGPDTHNPRVVCSTSSQ